MHGLANTKSIQLSVSCTVDCPGLYGTNHTSLLIQLFCCSNCGNHLVVLDRCNYGRGVRFTASLYAVATRLDAVTTSEGVPPGTYYFVRLEILRSLSQQTRRF